MKQYRRQIPLLFIFLFTLAACSQTNAITPTADSPTVTPTSKPTKTQTPTFPPISTPEGTATLDARELLDQQVKDFGIDCSYFQAIISPSGNWAAAACGYENDQTLKIANRSGVMYTLNYSDYLSDVFTNPVSGQRGAMGGLVPIHWTGDDQYLFFSPYIAFDGGATCFYGFGDGGLFRMSMKNGKISTILPNTQMMAGYFYAFSSNDRYLAYLHNDLHILDINSGENYSIKFDNVAIGNLTWSPDGSRLGFATCAVDPNDEYKIKYSKIQIFNVLSHEIQTIKDVPGKFLSIENSKNDSYLLITEQGDNWDEDFSLYYWDQDLLITATPVP